MIQYGAKGRAEKGQSYEDIIKFYYKESVKKSDDFPDEICVQDYGDMDYQEYLYGLAEMPSSWDSDALKAQAIAARSYSYRYAKADKCICTSQSCQVFSKSKSDNPPSAWKKAVDDTKGRIIGGSTDAAGYGWYSASSGGYVENVGWDSDGGWPGGAYEKKGGSPWFYKAWYTKSYNNSESCGRAYPWMTDKEMADILNSMVVFEEGSGSDRDHISPVTTSCWGGDPYSLDEMADKADQYGEKYSKVSGINVDISNNGYTSKVTLSTDRGTVSVNGETFKTVFNLRAPSYIAIRSRLYDFEKAD
jgi:peptidoglycan hydrolase-like amidase